MNTYAYASANPLSFIDQFGLEIVGEFASISVSDVDIDYEGLTPDLRRGTEENKLVDKLGDFNFSASGTLNVVVKCTEYADGCQEEPVRTWTLSGAASVTGVEFTVPYTEPVLPMPGMSAVIWADKILRAGQYVSKARPLIEAAGKAILESLTKICKGSSFVRQAIGI